MDLPSVEETFEANVAGYVAGLDAMIAAAERAAKANYEIIASLGAVQAAQNAAAQGADVDAAATAYLSGQTQDLAGASVVASANVEKLASRLNDQMDAADKAAAAAKVNADALNDMRDAALEAAEAESRLEYKIAQAAAVSETALVAVRPAMDEWRDSIEEALAAAEAAEGRIDAMAEAIDRSGDDAVKAAAELKAYTGSVAEAGIAAKTAADATDTAANQSRIAIGRWGLSWNALHWIIAGGAELLAVTLPAAVAAASGAFVLYQGIVEQVGFRMEALYGATEATSAMIGKTTGDVLGLGHAFQSAQNAANPIAYELLGEYVDAARSHMVDLAAAGLQVDRALGGLGAKIDVDLIQQGGQLNSLLSNMVSDLIEIGQVFGNLGHAILNFASDMPGLAEVLLRIADAASRVVLWISELPAPLITTFMVFEEMSRWGGGLVTVLGRLGLATSELSGGFFSASRFIGIFSNVLKAIPMLIATLISNIGSAVSGFGRFGGVLGSAGGAMRDFGADMTDAVAGLSTGWVAAIGVAAAALGFLVYKTWDARGATESWIASLNKAVSAASNLQAVNIILNGMADTTTRLAAAQQGESKAAADTSTAMGAAGRFAEQYAVNTSYATQKTNELTAEQQHLNGQMHNLISGAGTIAKAFGGNLADGMALADAAGVKLANTQVVLGAHMNQAGAQVTALVNGYKAMDQTGGILNNDMNALAASAGLQNTKVSSLNQAWDQFLSNATGLTGGIAGLNTDIGEINNAVTTAGTKFDVFGGKVVSSTDAAAHALTSFSGTGAQVWQNYNAALQQASQYTDSLRIAAADSAVGQKAYTQQIAYTVAQLLPYAKYSSAAAAELSILAQQAGGPATSSYKTLKEWVDKNTESTKQFNKQTALEEGALTDATKVAESFASTLDSSVAAALQTATISSAQLTQKAEDLNTAWSQAHNTVAGPVVGAFRQLVESLTQVYGNTKTAIGVADAYMRQQGATAGQVANLNRQIAGTVAWLSRIHSPPPVTITVNGQITGSGAAAIAALSGGGGEGGVGHRVAYQTGAEYTAAGTALVGEQGPELVRFGGGEQVVPSWQTAGIMHGAGGGGEGTINLTSHNVVNVGGQRMQSQVVTQSLTYSRRNPSNNLALRTR